MIYTKTVTVKSFLLKYLSYYHPTDPFVLSEKNRFGTFILNTLRFHNIERGKRYVTLGNTAKMKIDIKEHYVNSYGVNISAWHQYQFNNLLMDDFHDRMLDFVKYRHTGKKGDIKKALLLFIEKYEISEDELPFKTLEKMWERKSKRIKHLLPVK